MKTRFALVMAFTLALSNGAGATGIPVFDGANLAEAIISAQESVAQTLKQIEEYALQLQEYENMLKNTLAPAAYIWDQAERTMSDLMGAIDTLNYYKAQVGGIDAYLSKFQTVAYYKSSPCFSATGCSEAEWQAMEQNRQLASEARKRANDALFHTLDQQQDALTADAGRLETLQSTAQTAQGQMEALQYANMLASQSANQLLQIRAMLLAQQQAQAMQDQAALDRQAQEDAAAARLRAGSYGYSSARTW